MSGQPAHALREIASGDDLAVSRDELAEGIEGCLIDVLSDG